MSEVKTTLLSVLHSMLTSRSQIWYTIFVGPFGALGPPGICRGCRCYATDDWTYKMDQGVQIDTLYRFMTHYTDFEKAFDKVPHLGLINILKAYDIDSKLIVWIEDFLCNLKQRIGENECFSQRYTVSSRIPQGSILGL